MSVAPSFPSAGGEPGAVLHKRPAFAPLLGTVGIVVAIVGCLYSIRLFKPFEDAFMRIAGVPDDALLVAGLLGLTMTAGVVYDSIRRRRAPRVPLYLRLNRAFAYGLTTVGCVHLYLIARDKTHVHALAYDLDVQLYSVLGVVVVCAVAYVGWLHPLCDDALEDFAPYQRIIEDLKESYDFVLGINRPADWKKGQTGAREWFKLPELALYTNLIVFGGIGSGKTSTIVYTLLAQIFGKFLSDDKKRPSVVLMDLKGDNAKKVYDLARRFGREKEVFVVAPGNRLIDTTWAIDALKDHAAFAPLAHRYTQDDLDTIVTLFLLNGSLPAQYLSEQSTLTPILVELKAAGRLIAKDLIPPERFVRWNPLAGSQAADIRAAFLVDGISAASDVQSKDGNSNYFENQEGMWLANALSLHDNVMGVGRASVLDLYMFANDPKRQKELVNHASNDGTPSQLYFKNSFFKRTAEDQDKLIGGLKGSLKDLVSPTMQSTFCPANDDPAVLRSFIDAVVNKSGIVVFCVPSSYYTTKVTRVLGIMFLRSFQKQMERRSASQFAASGGNTDRLVCQITDEAWAFFNKGVADFSAVSRQAKTCSIFLSQSLDQIPERYRSTVQGNFRTSLLLSVNDPLTLNEYSKSFGEVKEVSTSTSTSENINDASHGVLTQSVSGKSQGLSVSTSTSERVVPRFSLTDIQHLPARRAVVQMYDGSIVNLAHAIEVLPYFRLPYHLTSPLEHPDVGCPNERGSQHAFVDQGSVVKCSRCPLVLKGERLDDLREYARVFPNLVTLSALTSAQSTHVPSSEPLQPPTPPSTSASPGAVPTKAKL